MESLLTDSHGRTLDYLRISVTDRCNFRCVYCLPPEGIPVLPEDKLLSFEEILKIARLYMKMGGRRIRLTGGEPLLRKNIVNLVSELSALPGLNDLALTTNGFLLEKLAGPLKEAGLNRINISLDSLNPERFAELTLCHDFKRVWRSIEKCLEIGLKTKVNVVAMKGITPDDIIAFGLMAKKYPLEVRFIEFMPLCGTGWHPEWSLPLSDIQDILEKHFSLTAIERHHEVAQSYIIDDGKGRLGFIASMTEPFCGDCSRLRLTAEGKLRSCLFSNIEIDLKDKLRNGASETTLKACIAKAVMLKPKGHEIENKQADAQELPRIHFVGG